MSSYFNVSHARSLGIGSPYKSIEDLYVNDPHNASLKYVNYTRTVVPSKDVLTLLRNPAAYQRRVGMECCGWGADANLLFTMSPVLLWFAAIMTLRYICSEPLARLGVVMGVVTENESRHAKRLAEGKRGSAALSRKNSRTICKFQNQLWLAVFYIASTIFGYIVQHDNPWFTFPLNQESSIHILLPHPQKPSSSTIFYYHYEIAFYFSELFSLLFIERSTRRSDFLEYCVHHSCTLVLLIFSYFAWEYKIGLYVMFIHDASDIMLAVSKALHYIVDAESSRSKHYNARHQRLNDGKTYTHHAIFRYALNETTVNVCFACFVVIFAFMRLYCLPMMIRATFLSATMIQHGNIARWILAFTLQVLLQSLHVYWATLICRLLYKLVTSPERNDIRSDNDHNSEEEPDLDQWRFGAFTKVDPSSESRDIIEQVVSSVCLKQSCTPA